MSVPKVVAVIGAGTMGPGMAAVLARAGSEVPAGTPGTR
jgi:3-hydroxyacyl-CoA dehydrogenase